MKIWAIRIHFRYDFHTSIQNKSHKIFQKNHFRNILKSIQVNFGIAIGISEAVQEPVGEFPSDDKVNPREY